MIKIRIRNDDHEIDLQFPISENKLYAKLAEIHAIEGKDAPQSAFVTEVYWPEELSMLKDRFANLDELNYLARRMESFDYHEYDQFLIGITKLENPTEKDLINLTFNLDHFTLCKDVSSYGKIGREYVMNTEGAVPAHDEDDPKYAAIGKALIDRGLAQITAKGLLIYNPFDELTEVYDGQTFPEYYYENINAITERILRLIDATNGHTAILFTSYKVLQAVYERAIHQLGKYEVFCMTRNNRKVISDFRKSRNGVLFASGSMWEGVDCVGDGLSSVIIVRLPFPLRLAAMEQKKEAIGDVAKFVHEYAVPEMLIKLRQGVGRLIRCETDTGVISILDSRAANGSYVPRVKMALLKYPTVDSVEEVKSFMESVKGEDYYA